MSPGGKSPRALEEARIAPPARLFRRARIHSPEPAPPHHDSLATVGDRVLAVGTEADCRNAISWALGTADPGLGRRSTAGGEEPVDVDVEVVDLAGRALVPGFIDAHLHPMIMSVFESHLRFDDATSLHDVLDAVRDAARGYGHDGATGSHPAVVGFQLDDARLLEQRLPTAAELDAVAPGRAVVLVRRDGHHAVASTTALAAAGFDRPGDPAGGYVVRDAAGAPTGLVGEGAVARLLDLMPEVTMESLEQGVDAWSRRLLRQGVTAISAICQTTPEGPSGAAGEMEAVAWSALVDRLPFDVQTILVAPDLRVVDDLRTVRSLHDPDAGRRVDAVKVFLDGTLGGASACMHQPFADRSHTAGMRTMGDDEVYPRMVDAHLAGLQICVHAIGDRANRSAADLFDRLLAEHPGPHRHRVEHASVLDEVTIASFARSGIACVVQPVNLRSEAHWLASRLGPDRLQRAYPFRDLLDAGVSVAGSSDAPIESTDVIAAMDAAIDRRGLADSQALTALEALRLYTTGASAARGTDEHLGVIRPGARADLVVLPDDPARCLPGSPEVLATYVSGVAHHRHPSLDTRPFTLA